MTVREGKSSGRCTSAVARPTLLTLSGRSVVLPPILQPALLPSRQVLENMLQKKIWSLSGRGLARHERAPVDNREESRVFAGLRFVEPGLKFISARRRVFQTTNGNGCRHRPWSTLHTIPVHGVSSPAVRAPPRQILTRRARNLFTATLATFMSRRSD